MVDEFMDVSNHEQLAVCFRWVDTNLEVHDEFRGVLPDWQHLRQYC